MVIATIQQVSVQGFHIFPAQPTLEALSGQFTALGTVLAQMIRDPDVLGQIQRTFHHFIESGQVWALLIGLAIGYLFRSFTSY